MIKKLEDLLVGDLDLSDVEFILDLQRPLEVVANYQLRNEINNAEAKVYVKHNGSTVYEINAKGGYKDGNYQFLVTSDDPSDGSYMVNGHFIKSQTNKNGEVKFSIDDVEGVEDSYTVTSETGHGKFKITFNNKKTENDDFLALGSYKINIPKLKLYFNMNFDSDFHSNGNYNVAGKIGVKKPKFLKI